VSKKKKLVGVEESFQIRLPLYLAKTDEPREVRRFIAAAGREVAAMIITQWSGDPNDYDVDIQVTLTKRENN